MSVCVFCVVCVSEGGWVSLRGPVAGVPLAGGGGGGGGGAKGGGGVDAGSLVSKQKRKHSEFVVTLWFCGNARFSEVFNAAEHGCGFC